MTKEEIENNLKNLSKEELSQCLKDGILKEVKPRKKLTKKEKRSNQ